MIALALLVALATPAVQEAAPVSTAAFDAARDRFLILARARTGEADPQIAPATEADPRQRDLAGLQTGDWRAFQASAGGQRRLRGFARADEAVALAADTAAWARAGGPPRAEAALAQVLGAAGLGTPAALPMKAVVDRLRFLFDFGTFGRFCPVVAHDGQTRLRWQMTLVDDGPPARGPGIQAEQTVWFTVEHGPAATTLSVGANGCG
ncbi:MAG: hypothetical protein H6706_22430 [Myxococcales bacterium]|nr:hypothetical protein [Myxococcales bacterium]